MTKLIVSALSLLLLFPVAGNAANNARLFKNPNCFCCDEYAAYLRQNGFDVEMVNSNDMDTIKQRHNVPEPLYGCHTLLLDGYVFEGLIPVDSIRRLLKEKPAVVGLSLPGMPRGAPGMPGAKRAPLKVYSFTSLPPRHEVYDVYAD
ncbi:DUF411 domain-containing protein [Alloalcanivorax xenomutans]|uniref:DUF411 domain-containing protein n=1 Tax=Alloalcanivorax xenomutans TaxID=1094342 RepID=A0A9Q3W3M7_9GAMM|nr:DUF411 domain-containing protein [Alloalcanivorax xenomutans]PHS71894.1 MAG: metal-binding protein [Alcanivorax sp.]ARB46068.1 hypothetical protein P40_12195 [Alloalcanivorax xenomutans]MCE7508404.1 DUF411 domain-containing protein [Alloalcanivorax xenomutans]MCE7521886.1 DUF411 domain-containing protein [Alloalcanivorax xenomutans]WOA29679.1 DUF411 domain-containing protein [Alloalcanivorax xenomutans]